MDLLKFVYFKSRYERELFKRYMLDKVDVSSWDTSRYRKMGLFGIGLECTRGESVWLIDEVVKDYLDKSKCIDAVITESIRDGVSIISRNIYIIMPSGECVDINIRYKLKEIVMYGDIDKLGYKSRYSYNDVVEDVILKVIRSKSWEGLVEWAR